MKNRLVLIGGSLGLLAVLAAGGYWLAKKVLRDREAALSYIPPTRPQPIENTTSPERKTVTYTEKDLAEMRRKGMTPPGTRSPNPIPPPNPNDAAVQRSLKTLEEVNRINEMNRRMQEQQERMRNQR